MSKPALVFGASGEQGRAVIEGLVERGYEPVYGFTRETSDRYLTDALGATLFTGDIQNPDHVRRALVETKAQAIFLVTTTELPAETTRTTLYSSLAEAEFQVIAEFFRLLDTVYQQDRLPRHVVFSTRDNVQRVVRELAEATGQTWIEPLDDGSVVPQYSAKGRGGEYAMDLLKDTPDLKLTLLTMPFLYSNFLGFFTPLPNETKTQWMLTACFGDGANKIDMMSAGDLEWIVPNVFAKPERYDGQNIRLVAERISMDQVAATFTDLFGKDVIYNPLTVDEVAALPFATAPAMAQMCNFLGDPRSLRHDLEATQQVTFPRKPQTFEDWLLTHSDSTAFKKVGLDYDAPEIKTVVVFGATSPEGMSVVKGLLKDERKEYKVRATTRHLDSPKAQALAMLDRVEVVYADFDDIASCQRAADGADGAFLVTDFYVEAGQDMETEERHARNVIDACEASKTVKHLVFSTMESIEEMNSILGLGLASTTDITGKEGMVVQFDAKARAAAYARTKKLSVTYVFMPCFSETFFERIVRRPGDGQDKFVLQLPLKDDTRVMCMSISDLGPAVANIFDSYQVYAGHEIGLVTDFVTVTEVRDIIEDVFRQSGNNTTVAIETETLSTEEVLEAKDTYMKDLGQMFAYMAHTEAVKLRHSVAKTMKLVPSARPLRQWVEANIENESFREKLGLR